MLHHAWSRERVTQPVAMLHACYQVRECWSEAPVVLIQEMLSRTCPGFQHRSGCIDSGDVHGCRTRGLLAKCCLAVVYTPDKHGSKLWLLELYSVPVSVPQKRRNPQICGFFFANDGAVDLGQDLQLILNLRLWGPEIFQQKTSKEAFVVATK